MEERATHIGQLFLRFLESLPAHEQQALLATLEARPALTPRRPASLPLPASSCRPPHLEEDPVPEEPLQEETEQPCIELRLKPCKVNTERKPTCQEASKRLPQFMSERERINPD